MAIVPTTCDVGQYRIFGNSVSVSITETFASIVPEAISLAVCTSAGNLLNALSASLVFSANCLGVIPTIIVNSVALFSQNTVESVSWQHLPMN